MILLSSIPFFTGVVFSLMTSASEMAIMLQHCVSMSLANFFNLIFKTT